MRSYKEPSRFTYAKFLSMSRRIFQCYLLHCLVVNAILVYGSLDQRISRQTPCSSCGKEGSNTRALPWYSQESDLQSGIMRDSPITPSKNFFYLPEIRESISQDEVLDDILSRQISLYENSRPYGGVSPPTQHRQIDRLKQQNLFFGSVPNQSAGFSSKQEIPLRDKFTNRHYFARNFAPRQSRESEHENLFCRRPRDKQYSISSSNDREFSRRATENFEDYPENEEDSRSKLFTVYRTNGRPLRENAKYASSSGILPQKSYGSFPPADIFEERRNAIEKSRSSINEQYDPASRGEYYSRRVPDIVEMKHDNGPYISSQNSDAQKPTKNKEFHDWDFIEDSLETADLEQLEKIENNFFDEYSMGGEEEIIKQDDNKQIDYNFYGLPRDLNIREPLKNEEFNDWDFDMYKNSQKSLETGRPEETEINWSQLRSMETERDIGYFENEEDINKDYFEDEVEKDTIENGTIIHNNHDFSRNMDIWKTIQEKGFLNNIEIMIPKNRQEIQKTTQLEESHPVEKNNNKYLQNMENKNIKQDGARIDTDRIMQSIDFNPYVLLGLSNILNAAKHSTEPSKTGESSETKGNVPHMNPVQRKDETPSENDFTQKDSSIQQDLFYSKNTYNMEKVNPINDGRSNIKDNMKNEASTELDPDIMDDVEDLPIETTEPMPIKSFVEFSTSKQ